MWDHPLFKYYYIIIIIIIIIFEYPKKSLIKTCLNQATQKNTCQIFLPKKVPELKIPNPKKSFDHPRHLKSGIPPSPPPPVGGELLVDIVK